MYAYFYDMSDDSLYYEHNKLTGMNSISPTNTYMHY